MSAKENSLSKENNKQPQRRSSSTKDLNPFHTVKRLYSNMSINKMIQDKEEALSPMDDLDDDSQEDENDLDHDNNKNDLHNSLLVLVSCKRHESYTNLLTEEMFKLNK